MSSQVACILGESQLTTHPLHGLNSNGGDRIVHVDHEGRFIVKDTYEWVQQW